MSRLNSNRHIDRHAAYITLGIFLFALALRLIYVSTAVQDVPIRADALKYTSVAYNLVNHGIYSHHLSAKEVDTMITPGYPLFLMFFSDNLKGKPDFHAFYDSVVYTQSVLSAITVLLITIIGIQSFGRWPGYLSGILASASPHLIVGTGYILTETLFIALMVTSLAIWCLSDVRRYPLRSALIFGLVAALAALVRPAYTLFPMFLVFLSLYLHSNWRAAAKSTIVTLLAMSTVWAPWFIYKQLHPAPKPQTSLAAAAFALGQYPDLTFKSPQLKGYPYLEDPEYPRMIRKLSTAVSVAWSRAKKEPLRYFQWYLFGKPEMFLSWSILVGEGGPFIYPVIKSVFDTSFAGASLLKIFSTLHPLFVLSGLVSILLSLLWLRRHGNPVQPVHHTTLALSSLLLYFIFIHTILAPLPRYSVPLHPVLYLAFSATLGMGFAFLRKKGLVPMFHKQKQV